MLELLGNLLDNACKWANKTVHMEIGIASELMFIISDDGLGASEEEIEAMVKRGVRVDESKSGSGLGLSIVHDIVSDYSGSTEYVNSKKMGGLQVTVTIPYKRIH
jgi:signal transduction histidine kinase